MTIEELHIEAQLFVRKYANELNFIERVKPGFIQKYLRDINKMICEIVIQVRGPGKVLSIIEPDPPGVGNSRRKDNETDN